MKSVNATGKRKTAVAQVWLQPGKGQMIINERSIEDYFPMENYRAKLLKPLEVTQTKGVYDVMVKVHGGGITGQSEAIQLGIARALVELDENNRSVLREYGLLTRDPRMVERKKYGQKKARKRFQFSKR